MNDTTKCVTPQTKKSERERKVGQDTPNYISQVMVDIILDKILFVYKQYNSITGIQTKHESSSGIENGKH
jgi:hypothetical protein